MPLVTPSTRILEYIAVNVGQGRDTLPMLAMKSRYIRSMINSLIPSPRIDTQ